MVWADFFDALNWNVSFLSFDDVLVESKTNVENQPAFVETIIQ